MVISRNECSEIWQALVNIWGTTAQYLGTTGQSMGTDHRGVQARLRVQSTETEGQMQQAAQVMRLTHLLTD